MKRSTIVSAVGIGLGIVLGYFAASRGFEAVGQTSDEKPIPVAVEASADVVQPAACCDRNNRGKFLSTTKPE